MAAREDEIAARSSDFTSSLVVFASDRNKTMKKSKRIKLGRNPRNQKT